MNKKYPKWIDEYGESIHRSLRHHDVNTHMPFNGWNFYPLFADLMIEKLHDAIIHFRRKGLAVKDITHLLPNHSSMKFKFVEIVMWIKLANTSPEKAKMIIDFFLESIQARAVGKPLFMNNKIHTDKYIAKHAKRKNLKRATREHASEIGKIITGSATLAHGLYNDFCTDLAYDVYGPYNVEKIHGKNTSLLIRSFGDLNPRELWKGHTPFPYKKIEISSVYKNVNMTPTYIACQMLYKESLVDNLSHFEIKVDNKNIYSLSELKAIREKLLKTASTLYVEYLELGFEKQKTLWLSQLCYQFKNLFDLVGHDWKPTRKMLERVKKKKLVANVTSYNISREEFYEKFGISYLKEIYRR